MGQHSDLFFAEHADTGAGRIGEVILHLLHLPHTAEQQRDLRLVPQVIQSPFHWGFFGGEGIFQRIRRCGQGPAKQRLHNHYAQPFAGGIVEAFQPSLVVGVDVIDRYAVCGIAFGAWE